MYFYVLIYYDGVYNITACMCSTMLSNVHFCFTTLVTSAFHSYWSRVFHACIFDGPEISSPAFSFAPVDH